MFTITLDVGNSVICDRCDKDYQHSEQEGGFYMTGWAICPDCAPNFRLKLMSHGELNHIKYECQEGQTFRDFVYWLRGLQQRKIQ